jgi:DNA-directed RNA polymerase subunit L
MNQVVKFFKTLLKGVEVVDQKTINCLVGSVREISVPMSAMGHPRFDTIQITFNVENAGNLREAFHRQSKNILDILEERKKKYELSIILEEVK